MDTTTKIPIPCIETKNLHYRFSHGQVAVDQVSLCVPEGSIYGFLGPNGAGKTTTLRLLLGLLKKQQGDVRFFGTSLHNDRRAVLARVGSMIETPSVYGHLSARNNLRIWAQIQGCTEERITEVLELVGLLDSARKKADAFSLGMKQRLGIAVALLHQPNVLILDEPTNGLDPTGIVEIRALLRRLNQSHQMTILISSHILSEVEKLVTHIGVINQGKMMFQGTLAELGSRQSSGVLLETGDNASALTILDQLGITYERTGSFLQLPILKKQEISEIIFQFSKSGIPIYRVEQRTKTLEAIFMDLIK